MRRYREDGVKAGRYRAGVVVVCIALVDIAAIRAVPAAPLAPPSNLEYAYPRTISYRLLGMSPAVKCNVSDQVFRSQVESIALPQYTALVVAAAKNTCGRRKAEQYKRLYPDKLVLAYKRPCSGVPVAVPGT